MKATRSLPPLFLLPAWSPRQLHRQARELASIRTAGRRLLSSDGDNKGRKTNDENKELTTSKSRPADGSNSISLYEELFPEEAQASLAIKRTSKANAEWERETREHNYWEDTFNAWDDGVQKKKDSIDVTPRSSMRKTLVRRYGIGTDSETGAGGRGAPGSVSRERADKVPDTSAGAIESTGRGAPQSIIRKVGGGENKIEILRPLVKDPFHESIQEKSNHRSPGEQTGKSGLIRRTGFKKEDTGIETSSSDPSKPVAFNFARNLLAEGSSTVGTKSDTGPSIKRIFPDSKLPPLGESRSRALDTPSLSKKREPFSVLVFAGMSKALNESDFHRLSPQSQHIEGWANGIRKVIVDRDPLTLAHNGMYYVQFTSQFAARNYEVQVKKMHDLAEKYTPKSLLSPPLPPPGFLTDGKDIHALLKSFTLIPPSMRNPMIKLIDPTEAGATQDLLDEGAVVARVQVPSKDGYHPIMETEDGHETREVSTVRADGGDKVLLSVDDPLVTILDIEAAIEHDGETRNLPWDVAETDGVMQLRASKRQVRREERAAKRDSLQAFRPLSDLDEDDAAANKKRREEEGEEADQRPDFVHFKSKFIVQLKNKTEAQRLVRAWHQRPFALPFAGSLDRQYPPMVSAEILW